MIHIHHDSFGNGFLRLWKLGCKNGVRQFHFLDVFLSKAMMLGMFCFFSGKVHFVEHIRAQLFGLLRHLVNFI